jgi:hypothetical protein
LPECLSFIPIENTVLESIRPALAQIELLDSTRSMFNVSPRAARALAGAKVKSATIDRLNKLSDVLNQYLGPDARTRPRKFGFTSNRDLRHIVERDYNELMLRLYPIGAWKSVVILSGGVLKALRYDLLTRDSARIAAAEGITGAPKKKIAGETKAPRSLVSKGASRCQTLFFVFLRPGIGSLQRCLAT